MVLILFLLLHGYTLHKVQHYLLLTLFSLLLFLPGIIAMPVTDRDEAHFAQASRQMLQTGQYFQVRFQDKTRFQKPPGINWLQVVSVSVFSDAESKAIWPYRLPSVLGALFSVLLFYFFAHQFVGRSTALLASALLATALLFVVEAHLAVTDASLLSAVLLMQGALWYCYDKGLRGENVHWIWALCFWFAMAYGMVLKGVTPLVGLLTILALCIIEKRVNWLRGLRPCRGLLFFILLTLKWLLMLNAAENSNYLMQMIHKDLLPKLQGGHESHGRPPLFHLAILPLTFWPASLFLWQGGVYATVNRHQKTVKFLLAWLLPTWLFFEIMPTKLPQYVLPTFPAIALLCALAINHTQTDHITQRGKWLHFLQLMWGLLSLGLAFVLALLPYLVLHKIPMLSFIIFGGISVLTLIAIYFSWQGAYHRSCVAVFLASLLVYPIIFNKLLPQLEPVWLARNAAQLIEIKKISQQKPLLVVGFAEPSLVFNLNTKLVKYSDGTEAKQIIKNDITRLALIDGIILNEWEKGGLTLSIVAQTKGFNYTKGRWVELFLVARRGEINVAI
ncbi:melitin resistance protein [Legionella lansingensis]|uniref:Melitin resistance protein n=1 Tax=Legionella lansingensis TaxID=45067 RepID=A0A0W0VXZ5_9GAMM|nr:glycosyltransferase family 39 protein [Legionella lansingensis]KTD24782.1 melitin resistance protein [Legionella lansingensis]SNV48936.1 melitin resistance protein [Legionella lansingensis]